jgi:hypothetical protein
VFISPNLAIDDNNTLVSHDQEAARRAIDDMTHSAAPPLYGQHQFDQLYSEVDVSGYRTPGGTMSGTVTPFGTLSRNISSEDLTSLNEAVFNGDISASALHSRLSRLHAVHGSHASSPGTHDTHNHNHEHSAPHAAAHSPATDYFNMGRPAASSNSQSPEGPSQSGSRRASEEHDRDQIDSGVTSGAATPYHPQSYEVENLSRVPSYSTAMRSSARSQYDNNLPDYQAVMSSSAPRPPPMPQQVHLRGGGLPHSWMGTERRALF